METTKTASPTTNQLGYARNDYVGAKSTLCSGCGHDSITNNLISALFQSSVNPYQVAKMSGIGCSSKTTAYFLEKSHGFNSIHGRMAPIATGAYAVNSQLLSIGVSGDGDTASIGMGGFVHLVRRNVPIVYIIENNGVYGLTKGQFSATADEGSTLKSGEINHFHSIDLCALAIELGCGFVARSFSGDAKQLVPLLRAAFEHNGTAIIDVLSPCITFANHEGSTRSYDATKEHNFPLHELGFVSAKEEIHVDYEEGTVLPVTLHDGSILNLKKIDGREHDPRDAKKALDLLYTSRHKQEFVTGLLYFNPDVTEFKQALELTEKPLSHLPTEGLRPSKEELSKINATFK
ncbi:MAG: 2-oxoacid:ferredoxin oxidoreductase subunit beta [Bdellovibrionaceae bacterium]|nr:2-oxoacid:ferredoxin oxidoreductase subunit beta [Pseudobdellovibrionaceae bacterium]